jgi:hypothetical protein
MTGGTIIIGLRVADMAARFALVNPVGYYVVCIPAIDFPVTIDTLWPVLYVIPIFRLLSVPMHLLAAVTFLAPHILLPMDIGHRLLMLTEVFLLYTTPVAGGADLLHRGFPLKQMAIQKTTINGIRPADVTLSATAVAVRTVAIHCAFHFVADCSTRIRSLIDDQSIGSQTYVKTPLVILINLIMAISTGSGGVGIGRISNNILVGGFPVRVLGVATVALVTRNFTVVFIIEDVAVNKDLLVRSQRLHSTASPLTFYLYGFSSRSDLNYFPRYLYQLLSTGMALKALGILIRLDPQGIPGNADQAKGDDQAHKSQILHSWYSSVRVR